MLSALKSIIKNNILGIAFFILVAVIIYCGIENTEDLHYLIQDQM